MAIDLKKLKVLLVEDEAVMRDLLRGVFESLGVGRVTLADNGESGFRVFQETNPDIIFLEWELKKMNGPNLIKKIRSDSSSPSRTVPIIMLTGYSAVTRVELARDSGVTEFMTKPFTANEIAKRLSYVVNKPRDFVEYSGFVGPDRRRRQGEDISVNDRRGQTEHTVQYIDSQIKPREKNK